MTDSSMDMLFPSATGRRVIGRFDGGHVTSNAGMLLVCMADRRLNLTRYLLGGVPERRQRGKVRHTLWDLLRQRIYAIALGYEDGNDMDSLADDPALRVCCGRGLEESERLAGQSSISRFENRMQSTDVLEMSKRLAEVVILQLPAGTKHLVLDVDASEDPCHGQQEFEFFNGHYRSHCYLPLFVHITADGDRQRLLSALLRAGNACSETGFCSLLKRAIELIRARFPKVGITLRGDAGFGHAEEIHFCEDYGLDFVLGLSTNERLKRIVAPLEQAAIEKLGQEDGRYYAEFGYKADSWDNFQRVIARIEVSGGKANTRYIVTSLHEESKQDAYEFYCLRGEQENRIKELKNDLSSGRTSCMSFVANQLRLLLHACASVLLSALADGLTGTKLAAAQVGTLRLRLLKVGALVKQSTRAIWLHLSSSLPDKSLWYRLHQRLVDT